MIATNCCKEGCVDFVICRTVALRNAEGEEQVCCPRCPKFAACNPELCRYSVNRLYLEMTAALVAKRRFLSAHQMVLEHLPRDYETLRKVRGVYKVAFERSDSYEVLSRGLLLFTDLEGLLNEKWIAAVNMAYLHEFIDPRQADDDIVEAVHQGVPVELVAKFYHWVRAVMQKETVERIAGVVALCPDPRLASALESMRQDEPSGMLLSKSIPLEETKALVHLLEEPTINDLDAVASTIYELLQHYSGQEVTQNVNILPQALQIYCATEEGRGDEYGKLHDFENARSCYRNAIKGRKLFIVLRPKASNYANAIVVLEKLYKIETSNHEEIAATILEYAPILEHLIDETSVKWESVGLRVGYSLCTYGDLVREEYPAKAERLYLKALACFDRNSAVTNFNLLDGNRRQRMLQRNALAKGDCLLRLNRYADALALYDEMLVQYPAWFEGYLHKANVLTDQGDLAGAEDCLLHCLSIDRSGFPAYARLIDIYSGQKRYADAIRTCTRQIAAGKHLGKPALDWFFFSLSRLYEYAGKTRVAINLYCYILAQRQCEHLEVHDRLASLFIQEGRYHEAIDTLQNKVALVGNDRYAYCRIGDCYLKEGDPDAALKYYRKAEVVWPDSVMVLSRLAKYHLRFNRPLDAIVAIKKAISTYDNKADTVQLTMWLGTIYRRDRDVANALACFFDVLDVAPSHRLAIKYIVTLAEECMKRRREPEADAILEKLALYSDVNASVLLLVGDSYLRFNRLECALAAYNRSLADRPDDVATHARIAQAKEGAGFFSEAVSSVLKIIRIIKITGHVKELADYILWLGDLYHKTGKAQTAFNYFLESLKLAPDNRKAFEKIISLAYSPVGTNPEAGKILAAVLAHSSKNYDFLCMIGDCFMKQRDSLEALAYYKQAEELDARRMPALQRMSQLYLGMSRFDEAIAYSLRVFALLRDDQQLRGYNLFLGDLYRKHGDKEEAVRHYLAAIDHDPGYGKAYNKLLDLKDLAEHRDLVKVRLQSIISRIAAGESRSTAAKDATLNVIEVFMRLDSPDTRTAALDLLHRCFDPDSFEYNRMMAVFAIDVKHDAAAALEFLGQIQAMPHVSLKEKMANLNQMWEISRGAGYLSARNLAFRTDFLLRTVRANAKRVSVRTLDLLQIVVIELIKNKAFLEAMTIAEALSSLVNHRDPVYLQLKGRALFGLERYPEAEAVFDAIIVLNSEDTFAYWSKGDIALKEAKTDAARDNFLAALAICEKTESMDQTARGTISCLNRLTKIAMLEKQYDVAIDYATRLLELDDTDNKIRTLQAECHYLSGNIEAALDTYRSLFATDPDNRVAMNQLIGTFFSDGASPYLEQLLELLPDGHPDATSYLVNLLQGLGKLDLGLDLVAARQLLVRYGFGDLILLSEVAHLLMRHTIRLFFGELDAVAGFVAGVFELFSSFEEVAMKRLFAEYWGADLGGYVRAYARQFEATAARVTAAASDLCAEGSATNGMLVVMIKDFIDEVRSSVAPLVDASDTVEVPPMVSLWLDYLTIHHGRFQAHTSFDQASLQVPMRIAEQLFSSLKRVFSEYFPHCTQHDMLHICCVTTATEASLTITLSQSLRSRLPQEAFSADGITWIPAGSSSQLVLKASGRVVWEEPLFKGLIAHIEASFEKFSALDHDRSYWDSMVRLTMALPSEAFEMERVINYTFFQLVRMYYLSKEDYLPSLERLHTFKGALIREDGKITPAVKADFYRYDDRLAACRFPRFERFGLAEACRTVQCYFEESSIPVTFLYEADESLQVFSDLRRFQDCVKNLVYNAANAMVETGTVIGAERVQGTIAVTVSASKDFFTFRCTDTGPGMSDETRRDIESGRSKGVGWRTIRNAVNVLRGTYSISSDAKGTVVSVSFPS